MPMSGHLALDIAPVTSALERLLAVIRRRGYSVDSMRAEREDNDRLAVDIRVSGERGIDILSRHLANLGDCRLVTVRASTATGRRNKST